MEKHQPAKTLNALCIVGVPNNKEVTVNGYNDKGVLVHSWDGNSDFHNHLQIDGLTKTYMPVMWFNQHPQKVNRPDVIINNINDADIASQSLETAKRLVASISAKWPDIQIFNHPSKIANTTRDKIYQLYKDIPGIYIPKVVRITPVSVADVLDKAQEHVGFPFLIRPCGAHQSQGLKIITSRADAKMLEAYAFDENDFYITEFVDYRGQDGFYRKCRLVIIGDNILPRHYMTGPDWLVHGNLHEEFMATNNEAKQAEENFINNYQIMIKPEQLNALRQIYKLSGLDYLGFDFTIRPDGSLLIFEINAAQNSFLSLDFNVFPYMKNTRANLINALNDTIRNKLRNDLIAKIS
jgi:glutathione synthase/RimK-type ligase-like ATP-grasp enzyme